MGKKDYGTSGEIGLLELFIYCCFTVLVTGFVVFAGIFYFDGLGYSGRVIRAGYSCSDAYGDDWDTNGQVDNDCYCLKKGYDVLRDEYVVVDYKEVKNCDYGALK